MDDETTADVSDKVYEHYINSNYNITTCSINIVSAWVRHW